MTELDRRNVLKMMSLGVVSVGAAGTLLSRSALARPIGDAAVPETPVPPTTNPEDAERAWWLVAPFVADSRVAGARLISMSPIRRGVITLELEGADHRRFEVHICKRDDELDLPPPARSRNYDFLLANGGKGEQQTSRGHGEVTIALARAAWRNETTHATLPLVTMRQRWATMRVPC